MYMALTFICVSILISLYEVGDLFLFKKVVISLFTDHHSRNLSLMRVYDALTCELEPKPEWGGSMRGEGGTLACSLLTEL